MIPSKVIIRYRKTTQRSKEYDHSIGLGFKDDRWKCCACTDYLCRVITNTSMEFRYPRNFKRIAKRNTSLLPLATEHPRCKLTLLIKMEEGIMRMVWYKVI